MSTSIIGKLEALHPLPDKDKKLLHAVVGRGRTLKSGEDIVSEGDHTDIVHVIIEGHGYRYKTLADGKRQIIGYLVPGDFCDLYGFLLDKMDHGMAARTQCQIAELTEEHILMLTSRPALARALWWSELVNAAILREWLVNMGRRSPSARVAHILCELLVRLQVVGQATADGFKLELSQAELGDTVGLTTVSVNRALQRLRGSKLIVQAGREITIPDVAALKRFAAFDPSYLHFRQDREDRP
ncbi:Crp/Fnr family transcriptional regulator [Chenggangzhangella methanolivorans]|uniref:Crp/Fnr family transcriptional regulator n=1 Tax=Chenggangzhangella methanolivorans TaxID=1437009 RepID=A0A9E6UNH7_9HYPH|nr:Crp/Fnr family transcriptional regulator [Chenggangzhangella methanolivorans]QZO01111.1 Crp/Fnr family transcriptional regulator [Chenggangzhangella methanolivorans]